MSLPPAGPNRVNCVTNYFSANIFSNHTPGKRQYGVKWMNSLFLYLTLQIVLQIMYIWRPSSSDCEFLQRLFICFWRNFWWDYAILVCGRWNSRVKVPPQMDFVLEISKCVGTIGESHENSIAIDGILLENFNAVRLKYRTP